ncbi:acetylglutamate semialdehyde dehydrogenase [Paenibacillus odorifer]|jgi:hypothetical protein|uniref:acetylglutamate semialdehyde dehydrogenase n=1 Tax=Paenibacillus odorifer TaxID=189426 RepID=UPI00096E1C57|nr:acetylglutamate semialdehyde dehydrogenase [Paenibacillus odorifer]OME03382.1 acetylglutamate semialdehyde dehydrogenase [Paenibacillus odorifer]
MSNEGLTAKELLLSQYYTEEKKFREITRLDEKDHEQYKHLLQELVGLHEGSVIAQNTVVKGKALENLVKFLLVKSSVFEVYENIRNTTNEIDELLELNHIGRKLKDFITLPGELYLSECKNYDRKISVTWVGKFYTLLESNASKIGILFSYHGFTGRNWNDATGLTRKLFLLKEDLKDRTYIIDINKDDFKKIEQGHSLLELIDIKMKALRVQTNFEEFLREKHPALLEEAE